MSATLSVWKFNSTQGAEDALTTLTDLASQELVKVHDAATVRWEQEAKKPKTTQARDMVATGALGGTFWGFLFGLIFFVPLLGAAIGAGAGALSGSLTDVGIDDGFIKRVRERVTPGSSALFVLASDATLDKVKEAFAGQHPELLHTNLDHAQEENLRAVFAE